MIEESNYGEDSPYQAYETSCDGRDNDCDGITDEGCECIDGQTRECGSNVGECSKALRVPAHSQQSYRRGF